MKKLILFLFILPFLSACKNEANSFPDFTYSAVYFAYQYPVRTIVLGSDIFDNSLDTLHECKIEAVIGGLYTTKHDVAIDFVVADTICTGYSLVSSIMNGKTDPTVPISPMPHDYYSLASNQIVIKKGDIAGGVIVHLTDKFFADTAAIRNNYVIPIQMTTVTNADSILQGRPLNAGTKPRMLYQKGWDVAPKSYVLYCVKYINTWHGYYLRRGKDVLTGSVNSTIIRHPNDVTTYDNSTTSVSQWLSYLTTTSLSSLKFPVTLKDASGTNFICNLNLTFDAVGNCIVSSPAPTVFTASGTGRFVKKGEKNSWGNVDRDVLYLNYTINHITKGINIQTTDTLVMRNRGEAMELFTVK